MAVITETKGTARLTFHPRPKERKDWREAGFMPIESLTGVFPASCSPASPP